MRYLGAAAPHRVGTLPDIPAISEEVPGFESVLWFAVFAPKGTPDAIAERLRNAVVQAVGRPEYRKSSLTVMPKPRPALPKNSPESSSRT